MKFLQHEPWCLSSFWNTAITQISNGSNIDQTATDPKLREKSLQTAIDRIRRVLSPIMIRRTKDSLTKDGVPILILPPIESKIVKVILSDSEREFYNAILARSLEVFDGFIKEGTAAKAYFQIFSLLSRLRQSCDHIALTVKSKLDDDEWISSTNMIDVGKEKKLETNTKSSSKSTDTINDEFLNNLMKKFYDQQEPNTNDLKRNGSDGSLNSSKRVKTLAFISTIAKNISQAIEDKAKYMDDECPICLDHPRIEDAVCTPCGHIFCRHCLVGAIRSQSPTIDTNEKAKRTGSSQGIDSICPTCQEKFHSKKVIGLSDSLEEFNIDNMSESQSHPERGVRDNPVVIARQILNNAVSGTESSKMKAIMNELHEIWKMDPGSKVLMFSHYLGFLDLLGAQFKANGIPYFRLDGSLNVRERMHVLDEFRTSATPKATTEGSIQKGTVLLMSMSAGGEGLNIVSASSCFILEPW